MTHYFTVKEVANVVRRSTDTIYRWINEGFIKNFIKVKDGYLIPEEELKRLLSLPPSKNG